MFLFQDSGTLSRFRYANVKLLIINYDMKDYQAEVCRYQPKTKAEVDKDKPRLVNSSYHVKTEFNNCFIILLK